MAGTITHAWNGTILTITSDSGTSAMDLKGAKGDDGTRGPQGIPGDANLVEAVERAETAATVAVEAAREVAGIANAIKPTATGEIATAADSGNYPLEGLTIYGKTTQAGTPTPTTPIDLVNCGSSGSISVKVCGKNILSRDKLLNGLQVAQAGATAAIKEGYGWRKEVTTDMGGVEIGRTANLPCLLPGVVYTLSFVAWCDGTGKFSVDCYPDSLPEMVIPITSTPTRYTWTFTSNKPEMANAVIRTHGHNTGSEQWIVRVVDIQLEVGSVATEYEPYKDGGSVTLNTPNGLPGIPVSSGGNYTDSTGQQWICDEIDLGKGVYRRNINIMDAASITWHINTTGKDGGRVYYTTMNNVIGGRDMLSNRFAERRIAQGEGWNNLNIGEATVIVDNDNGVEYIIICVPAIYNTIAALNDYFTANETQIYCKYNKPTETPLTAAEIAAFNGLYSQYPNTIVYTDANAGIAATYVADTKLYIDNKFNELATALVAMGG